MDATLTLIFGTALASSVATVALLALVYRLYVRGRVERRVARIVEASLPAFREEVRAGFDAAARELLPRFREELGEAFEESAAELLPRFRAEVGSAFEEAAREMLPRFRREVGEAFSGSAEELLPRFRREVEEGFASAAETILPRLRAEVRGAMAEALTALAGGELIDETARRVAKTGSSIVETGLNLLLRSRDKRRADE